MNAAPQTLHITNQQTGNKPSWNPNSEKGLADAYATLGIYINSCDSATFSVMGNVKNMAGNEYIVSKSFDYGDSTTGTQDQNHTYTVKKTYLVTFTAVTSLGNTYTTKKSVTVTGLPMTIHIYLKRGVQDTLFGVPDYRDMSYYKSAVWGNGNFESLGEGWYYIPTEADKVNLEVVNQAGCNTGAWFDYKPLDTTVIVDTIPGVAVLKTYLQKCDSATYSVAGSVDHLAKNEQITSVSYDYGDGTNPSDVSSHTYTARGTYKITYTARTSLGKTYTTSDSVPVTGLPTSISLSIHHGAQDTIFAKPDYRDTSFYTVLFWGENVVSDYDNRGWYVIPTASGSYYIYTQTQNGCNESQYIDNYTLPPTPPVVDTAETVAVLKTYLYSKCDSASYTVSGKVEHLKNDTIISELFNYGDGSALTDNSGHTYSAIGNYKITYTALTSSGKSYSASDSVYVGNLPISVSLSVHHGVQDTIFAKPDYRDTSFYTVQYWAEDIVRDYDNHNWYFIPDASGSYAITLQTKNGCNVSDYIEYKPLKAVLTVTPYSCDSATYAVSGTVNNLPANETIVSKTFHFGDGGTATEDATHLYTVKGDYTVYFTAVTSSGSTYEATQLLKVQSLPMTFNLSVHPGIQDSILATPDYRDRSEYRTLVWRKDGVILSDNGWIIMPTEAGLYELQVTGNNGCQYSVSVDFTPSEKPAVPAQVTAPAENAGQLDLSADFGNVTFNTDNEFTVELTVKDPAGRTLAETQVVSLGAVKGTDPTALSVVIPASLPCASSYSVRVVSSSPADTTLWSATFAIMNQPAQPVIQQVGDSLFTSSIYDLQWYKDDVAITGATGEAIRARANGSYKVAALNGETCTSISDARAVVITAISNVTLGGNTVSAYPNPSEGPVYLKFGYPLSEKVLVKVYNLNGAVVYSATTVQQQTLLNLSGLPKGFYTVEVSVKDSRKVMNIILQ